MSALDYFNLLDAVETYYGSGSDQWSYIVANLGTNDGGQVANLLKHVPGVNTTVNKNGKVIDYWIDTNMSGTASNIGSSINSNTTASTIAGSVTARIPSLIERTSTTGIYEGVSGVGYKPDTGLTVKGVSQAVSTAIGAVAVGATIGKVIGDGLYNANPQFWASPSLSTLSETDWNEFTTTIYDETIGGAIDGIQALFGIDGDDTTMYVDENFAGYMAWWLNEQGALTESKQVIDIPEGMNLPESIPRPIVGTTMRPVVTYTYRGKTYTEHIPLTTPPNDGEYGAVWAYPFNGSNIIHSNYFYQLSDVRETGGNQHYVYDNKDVYFYRGTFTDSYAYPIASDRPINYTTNMQTIADNDGKLAWLLYYNAENVSNVKGINPNPNSTQFDPTGVGSVATALGALKNQYPELWDNAITRTIPQEDGTDDTRTYIPVPIPNFKGATDQKPTTGTPYQKDPSINPENSPEEEQDNLADNISKPTTPSTNPNTGGGITPSITPSSQQASSLWAIYNPSLSALNSLGAWLWSDNFIDQIKKIFNDPMQAIIGLHKVYASPNISGSGNIKVGYLDTGVGSNIVGNQFTYVDCGSVSLREYYGNVLDYAPFTTVKLYLPFIGIVPLDIADVARSTISVRYGVDVLTGACIANVSVQRDISGGVLYTYSGNCASQYPLSSGNYMGMFSGAVSAIGSLATGNVVGALGSALGMRTNVEHSGSFTGNAGAMGIKTPYLIVSRPQSAMNNGFPNIEGYPSNVYTYLKNCSGFVRVKECHIENIQATENELDLIESALKEGVIL